ncbi:MAG: oxidoreductase [Candidatus Pacebacteria bacterium]|nr:oxidoreductase [Candidatus Paceibacterota bacterium]
MNFIDKFLNNITMYRLALYGLSLVALVAIVLGFAGAIPYSGLSLVISLAVILAGCYLFNHVFAWIFKAPTNVDSFWITGFILFFLAAPTLSGKGLLILVAISAIAMLSKYTLAFKKKHLFNPAAITAVILGLLSIGDINWWVATPILNMVTLVVGLLIVRKLRRFPMFFAFLIASIGLAIFTYVLPSNISAVEFARQVLFSWQLIFFGTIMFTEPMTTPPTKKTQIVYGVIVGLLFSSQLHIGNFYMSPELALVIGNIFSYLASSKQKLVLHFKSKKQISATIYDFVFSADQKLRFKSGQYLEWTLPHKTPDTRGNRRFFTVASSPTEQDIHLGIRIAEKDGSTFKKHLLELKENDSFVASQLAGEFTLPDDASQKLVFIAGGIGVTPFRSMMKYLLDINELHKNSAQKNERRDIALFYLVNTEADIAYREIFEEAQEKIGLQFVPLVDVRINAEMIREKLPDFAERYFYLSGPNGMVESYKKMLSDLGVPRKQVKVDYFPGY